MCAATGIDGLCSANYSDGASVPGGWQCSAKPAYKRVLLNVLPCLLVRLVPPPPPCCSFLFFFFLSPNINPSLMCAHACESLISPLPQLIWPWHRLHFIEETAARQREAPINWRTGKPITYLKIGLPISGKALRGVVFHVAYTRPRIRQYVGLLTMTNPLFVLPAQPMSFLFSGESISNVSRVVGIYQERLSFLNG